MESVAFPLKPFLATTLAPTATPNTRTADLLAELSVDVATVLFEIQLAASAPVEGACSSGSCMRSFGCILTGFPGVSGEGCMLNFLAGKGKILSM